MKNPFHFIIPLMGLLASAGAFACSCARLTLPESYDKSAQVFLAMVTDAQVITEADRSTHVNASVDVVEAFKGAPRNGDILRSGLRPRTYCEIGLTKGDVYLVYLSNSNWVGMCNARYYDPEKNQGEIEKLRALRDKKVK